MVAPKTAPATPPKATISRPCGRNASTILAKSAGETRTAAAEISAVRARIAAVRARISRTN
jgi:hypothetical protein